jgi:uncharacterized membrane protein
MEMSFKEKSIWISLISTISVFAYYFYNVAMLVGVEEQLARQISLSLGSQSVFLVVVIEVVFQGLLAASNHRDAKLGNDERDKAIENKASHVAYMVLIVGVCLTLGRLVVLESYPSINEQHSSLQIPLLTAHILLFSLILAEVTRFALQLFYYRRGY